MGPIAHQAPVGCLTPQCKEDHYASLKSEHNRLKTFASLPVTAFLSPILCASAGFVYVGNGVSDAVRCVFCGVEKSGWQKDEKIEIVHAKLSSKCPMVTKTECENITLSTLMSWGSSFTNQYNVKGKSVKQKKNHHSSSRLPSSLKSRSFSKSLPTSRTAGNVRSNSVASSGVTNTPQSVSKSPTIQQATTEQSHASKSQVAQEAERSASSVIVTNVTYSTFSNRTSYSTRPGNVNRNEGSCTNVVSSDSTDQAKHSTSTVCSSTLSTGRSSISSPVQSSTTSSESAALTGHTSSPANNRSSNMGQRNGRDEVDSASCHRSQSENPQNTGVNSTPSTRTDSQQSEQGSTSAPTYEQLSILTARPKRQEYAVNVVRLQSFQGWPEYHHLKPEDLADAGFFYTGYSDTTRCFYCGGGLRNWEMNDDVWVEHARWFPKCVYMKITKGINFIEAVQKLSKDQEEISYYDVMNELGQRGTVVSNQENQLKRDPAVLALTKFGIEHDILINTAKTLKQSNVTLTSDKLYEQIKKEEKLPQKLKSAVLKNKNETVSKGSVESMRNQNVDLRQQTLCKICLDKEVGVVFLPCGHFVSCTDCASALKVCPVCRDDVKGMVRAFTS